MFPKELSRAVSLRTTSLLQVLIGASFSWRYMVRTWFPAYNKKRNECYPKLTGPIEQSAERYTLS